MSRLSDRAASETTASSARSASSAVSRTAVFARIVAMPSRRLSCSARWVSLLVSSARTRARSSRTSRATTWNFVRVDGRHAAALDGCLDLADGAGEHRDDAVVVAPRPSLVARGATASARSGAGLVEPQTPPPECPARSPRRNGAPARARWGRAMDVEEVALGGYSETRLGPHGSARDRRVGARRPAPVGTCGHSRWPASPTERHVRRCTSGIAQGRC